jgi:hypothetical protein
MANLDSAIRTLKIEAGREPRVLHHTDLGRAIVAVIDAYHDATHVPSAKEIADRNAAYQSDGPFFG